MTRPVDTLHPRVWAVAQVLQRLAQNAAGQMLAEIPLADEDEEVFNSAVTTAYAVVQALDALPPQPRKVGQLNAADAQALRLDLGAEAIALLAWMPGEATVDIALAATGNRTAAWRSSSANAAGLTDLVAAAFARSAPAPVEPTAAAVTSETSA